jgi:K+ transporter
MCPAALLLKLFRAGRTACVTTDRRGSRSSCLVPSWALLPLVALATAAAIDRVTGADLRCLLADAVSDSARLHASLDVEHTRRVRWGQIYVPQVNWD